MARPRVVFLGTHYWEPFGELASVLRQHGIAADLHLAPARGLRGGLAVRMVRPLFDTVTQSVRPGPPAWLRGPVLRELPTPGTLDMHAQDDLGHCLLTVAPRRLAPLRHTSCSWEPSIVYDKWRLTDLARRIGVAVPASWHGRAVGEYPVVVKAPVGFGGTGVRVAHNRAELDDARAVLAAGAGGRAPFLQELAGERLVNVGAVALNGDLTVATCFRPVAVEADPLGPAASIEVVEHASALAATAQLARALGYTGMLNADFVLGDDGIARFIDLNPRPFGSWTALQLLGADILGGYLQTIGLGDGPHPGTPARGTRIETTLRPPAAKLDPEGLERWHEAALAHVRARADLLGETHTGLSFRRVALWHSRARLRSSLGLRA